MDWPTLDTRWWNLSLGVLAMTTMAACGPTILLDDGDSVTDTDGPQTSPTDPTTQPPPGVCQSNSECDAGEICVDNQCVQDYYYCQDGGCCYDYGYGDCCYGDCCYGDDCYYPPYEECFDDVDCDPGALCVYGGCQALDQLPGCDEPDLVPLPLPVEDDQPVVSLAFVDGNGDEAQDLLVGRPTGARLHFGSGAPPVDLPLPAGEVAHDAVSGDFDGDQVADIALTDGTDSITILLGDGAGGFVEGTTTDVPAAITKLVALQWDSDGVADVAGITSFGNVVLHLGDGAGGLMGGAMLDYADNTSSLVTGRFDDDEQGDLIAQHGDETLFFLGNNQGNVSLDGILVGSWERNGLGRKLLAGDVDGLGRAEVLAHTNRDNGWLTLEIWHDAGDDYRVYAVDEQADHSALGDYDGDGFLDVVLAGDDRLTLVRGLLQGHLDCQVELSTGVFIERLAVGDFDGDGDAEIVVASGAQLVVLTTQ